MRVVVHVSQIITLHQFREILYTVIKILKIPGDMAAEQALTKHGQNQSFDTVQPPQFLPLATWPSFMATGTDQLIF